jgi:N-lysine methyltransferase SETD6
MKATKLIKAGEEIFNDYGPLPRSDLLRMYGYVTENYAQHDVVEIDHDLLVDVAGMKDANRNKAWVKREDALDEIGIIDDGYSLPLPLKGTKLEEYLPGNIHMLLRGLCLDATTTKMPKMNYQDSVSIEEAALLSTVATKRLSEYSTSLEQDRELLCGMKDPGGNWTRHNVLAKRYRMAVHVRAGEKEILHDIVKLCQSHIVEKTNQHADEGKKRKTRDGDGPPTSKKLAKKMP